ncbi:hypothetical protein C4573_02495 [Candidatus Woesearchaeota archaeon]|nr:MAG: hypothetical protein C4573_02495 [Candidatus Woesearchaeota archaeon]
MKTATWFGIAALVGLAANVSQGNSSTPKDGNVNYYDLAATVQKIQPQAETLFVANPTIDSLSQKIFNEYSVDMVALLERTGPYAFKIDTRGILKYDGVHIDIVTEAPKPFLSVIGYKQVDSLVYMDWIIDADVDLKPDYGAEFVYDASDLPIYTKTSVTHSSSITSAQDSLFTLCTGQAKAALDSLKQSR